MIANCSRNVRRVKDELSCRSVKVSGGADGPGGCKGSMAQGQDEGAYGEGVQNLDFGGLSLVLARRKLQAKWKVWGPL